MINYFYQSEKGLLLEAYKVQRPSIIPQYLPLDLEIQALLWLTGILCLGYVSGIRKAVFTLFTYHVSLKLVQGEYEKYFSDSGAEVDMVSVGLGLFMGAIGIVEIVGIQPLGRRKIVSQHQKKE
ncbi:hypothetical protein FGO68_gene8857 [Halteria grandinella]|uniref:Uncharacterized protein n=1 Tax=Halteria grandinella TaxID=5974 RepID=A0A8J8T2A5_HALGN|nr:hypothetical protein FGO68_gene8857 [Halteria grandinella]